MHPTFFNLRHIASILLFLILLSLPLKVSALPKDKTSVQQEIETQIARLKTKEPLSIANCTVSSVIVLPALYERFNYEPLWTNTKSIEQYFTVLTLIHEDGLNSDDYHTPLLKDIQGKINSTADPALQANFDILLTDSLIRLGYHLLVGKVDPVELDSNWNMDRTVCDLAQILDLAGAITDGDIVNLVDTLRPQAPLYNHLKAALSQYRQYEKEGGWLPVANGPVLKKGVTDSRVTELRKRLHATGDISGENLDSPFFDDAVTISVEHFQKRHGLKPDGIVGKQTLAALNIPVQDKINILLVNLERCRWILHDLPRQFVFVDIAGFQVKFFRQGKIIWQSRAQVGKTYRKTPVFKSDIKYLEMNPTWTVPPTIYQEDILPKVKKNPDYLKEKNMRVITYGREVVDESTINWSQYPKSTFPYLIRQDPGPTNALGQIKFMFANAHDVYLHDTPSKALFDSEERAFSSGCVRIENPFQFAEILLADNDISYERIVEIVEAKKTEKISLKTPVAIMLLYATATSDQQGNIYFKKDIYDRDAAVLTGLQQPFSFRDRPVLSQKK